MTLIHTADVVIDADRDDDSPGAKRVTLQLSDGDGVMIFERETDFGRVDVTEDACRMIFGGHFWDNGPGVSGATGAGVGSGSSRHCQLCGRHETRRTEWRAVGER